MSQLDALANHRDAILLAEAVGWLHDYRKCSDEQLKVQAANKTPQDQALPRNQLSQQLANQGYPNLLSTPLQLLSAMETLDSLLNKWENKWNDQSAAYLLQCLSRCHNTAHFDKQDPIGGKQNYPIIKVSSPFGFEQNIPNNLTTQLWSGVPWTKLASYTLEFRLKNTFTKGSISKVRD